MASVVKVPIEDIDRSFSNFDLNAPLTDEELKKSGMVLSLPSVKQATSGGMPLLQDIEDTNDEPVDAVAVVTEVEAYNQQYAHYLRCQSLAALVSFAEGWKSFEDLALKAFVQRCRRDDEEYKGDDPNRSFKLRIRKQTAEDFVKFIQGVVNESIMTPKPSLKK